MNLPDHEDLFLKTSGCGKKFTELFLIPNFTSRMVDEQDPNVIHLGKNAKLSITDRSRFAKLSEISIADWNVANTRILYHLIETGQLQTYSDIQSYLCYTVKGHITPLTKFGLENPCGVKRSHAKNFWNWSWRFLTIKIFQF